MGFKAWLSPTQTDRNGDWGRLDVTSTMTWRHDAKVTSETWSIHPESHSDFGYQAVAMGPSRKRHVGFHSFLAGRLILPNRLPMQKFIKIEQIPDLLEGFFFTVATVNRCDGNRPCHVFSATISNLTAKFGARLSINGVGVAGQTHTVTLLVL